MNENDEVEIDLVEMCKYFFSKWIIILAMIVRVQLLQPDFL